MELAAIAQAGEANAYGWTEAAARSGWPGLWAIAAAALIAGVYSAVVVFRGQGEKRPRIGFFALGLAVWFFTLSGPLESLALNRLYSAYVLQQILLVFAACPALLAGIEGWMMRPLVSKAPLRAVAGFTTRPGVALLIFIVVFTTIHVPAICNQLCHVRPFYHTVRISLFLAGLVLWWPVLGPEIEHGRAAPRLSQPMQGLYLLVLMLAMSAVAAPITFAETVLYHFYMGGAHPLGLSPLADQVIGGLMMWVLQGTILTAAASVIFVRWLSTGQRGEQPHKVWGDK